MIKNFFSKILQLEIAFALNLFYFSQLRFHQMAIRTFSYIISDLSIISKICFVTDKKIIEFNWKSSLHRKSVSDDRPGEALLCVSDGVEVFTPDNLNFVEQAYDSLSNLIEDIKRGDLQCN